MPPSEESPKFRAKDSRVFERSVPAVSNEEPAVSNEESQLYRTKAPPPSNEGLPAITNEAKLMNGVSGHFDPFMDQSDRLPRSEVIKIESAYKPGSVEDDHSSGIAVTGDFKRPTRKHGGTPAATFVATSLFGLAPGGVCRAAECCHRRGALLPHRFTLTGVIADA